jgi:hypothetical protein
MFFVYLWVVLGWRRSGIKGFSKAVTKLNIEVLEDLFQAGANSRGESTRKNWKNAPNVNDEIILGPIHGRKSQFIFSILKPRKNRLENDWTKFSSYKFFTGMNI